MLDEIQVRREKLEQFQRSEIDPYPKTHTRDTRVEALQASFDEWVAEGKTVTVAGRLMAVRVHGGLAFAV